ncbi:MAG TPA: MaoC family dehydratase N-terminal domain-containing protein [Acidimicrobiia bacterium]
MPDTWISDEMRAAIGTELMERVSFPVSVSDIRRWAVAVYYPEPPPREFWDEEYAADTPFGGIVAPEEFNPFAWMTQAGPRRFDGPSELASGTEARIGITPPATTKMLNGGMETTYTGVRMRPGDVIRSVMRLDEYSEREGRLGLMLFSVNETRWTNQDDALIKVTRDILIRY